MTPSVLQRLILPDESRADRSSLYARWPKGHIRLADSDGILRIDAGSEVDFSTFFNVFSHAKWQQLTGIQGVALWVAGSGRARIVISAIQPTGAAFPVAEQQLTLMSGGSYIDCPPLHSLPGTVLAVTVSAPGGGVFLAALRWTTFEPPLRPVHLAAVVTTFRREQAARTAIRRFRETIIPQSLSGDIELFVVDNGRSLVAEPGDSGITVIPNSNLGGAGGFARGLIEVMAGGRFSHALFMDDDASCEPESIWRTMSFLAYATDPKTAVAGAMLHADQPTWQYEKGAIFNREGRKRPVFEVQNAHRDVGSSAVVAANDALDRANYGAWWFFAFPLASTMALPFPFFVRGDDTDFSLGNDFRIVSLNGVAAWCDNFGYKLTPQVEYLAARSWLALALMHGDAKAAKRTYRFLFHHALTLGLRFDYASMEAVLEAVEHVAAGPSAFGDEPAPLATISRLKSASQARSPDGFEFAEMSPLPRVGFWRRLLGRLTVGGHIGPRHRKRGVPHAALAWDAPRFGLTRFVAAAYGPGNSVQIYERDRKRMRRAMARLIRVWWAHRRRLAKLGVAYRSDANIFRTESYWRGQFDRDLGEN